MLALRIASLALFVLLASAGRVALHALPEAEEATVKEVLLVPPGKVLRQVDLGHHSLAADLLFIRANLYYGHHILTDENLPWLSDFIDIIMELDPTFKKVYLWGSLVVLFPKREMLDTPAELVHRANRILEKGMQRFPDDHRFAMRIAFNHYYELGDADAAIPYFKQAAETPGAPRWLTKKLLDLYSIKGRDELAKETLKRIIAEETDPVLSDALKRRLNQLLDKQEREELVARRQELVRQWQQSYAHLPYDLYLLIREP